MLKFFKFVEILICLQTIFISTMIPVFSKISFIDKDKYNLEIPITWQIPIIILLSLIFRKKIVFLSFTLYLFIGLLIVPIFHQGGSLGYLITPNFGYLLGIYPLIKIMDNLNKKNKIYIIDFLKNGILGITSMHIIGGLYSIMQMFYHKDLNIFLYNIGNYSLGKIGYHLLMLIPIILFIKPINFFKYRI